ncbi:MAG TPA: hypothetical protein VN364_11570 [Bellilinea sp.]|nr:hypothetical protein [Bellilinea sp.]
MSKPGLSQRLTFIVLLILAICGLVLIGYATEVGPWAYSDSAAYLATAQNIADGRGPVLQNSRGEYELIPLHTPLYPVAVSLPMALGVSPLQSSRWLNAILFGLTIFLAGWSTFSFTRSFWLSTTAAGLILASFEPVRAFSGAMSEGLFLFLGLASLFVLARSVTEEGLPSWMPMLSGVLCGLAILTRYTGLVLLVVGVFILALFTPGRLRARLRPILAFSIPGILLPGLWLVPVFLRTHSFADRQIGGLNNIVPNISAYFQAFFSTLGSWLPFIYRGNQIISPSQKLIIGALVLILLAVIPIILLRRRKDALNQHGLLAWGATLLGFTAGYIALHLGAFVTAVTQPDVNGRLLVPIYLSGILMLPIIFTYSGRLIRRQRISNLVFVGLALLTVWYFHGKMQLYLYDMHHFGDGYTSKRWNENPIFSEIAALETAYPLASNDPGIILFYTSRFPDQLRLTADQKTYLLDLPETQGLVLFKLKGEEMIGAAYESLVTSARERYQVVYEDNEGIFFLPR